VPAVNREPAASYEFWVLTRTSRHQKAAGSVSRNLRGALLGCSSVERACPSQPNGARPRDGWHGGRGLLASRITIPRPRRRAPPPGLPGPSPGPTGNRHGCWPRPREKWSAGGGDPVRCGGGSVPAGKCDAAGPCDQHETFTGWLPAAPFPPPVRPAETGPAAVACPEPREVAYQGIPRLDAPPATACILLAGRPHGRVPPPLARCGIRSPAPVAHWASDEYRPRRPRCRIR